VSKKSRFELYSPSDRAFFNGNRIQLYNEKYGDEHIAAIHLSAKWQLREENQRNAHSYVEVYGG